MYLILIIRQVFFFLIANGEEDEREEKHRKYERERVSRMMKTLWIQGMIPGVQVKD